MYWEFSTKFVGTIIGTSTELSHTKYRKPESLLYGFSLSHGFIVSCKVCHLSWATGTELWISSCVLLVFIIFFLSPGKTSFYFWEKSRGENPKDFCIFFFQALFHQVEETQMTQILWIYSILLWVTSKQEQGLQLPSFTNTNCIQTKSCTVA